MEIKRRFICSMLCVCVLYACFATTSAFAASPNFDVITADSPDGFVKICADLNRFGALDVDGKVYIFGDGTEQANSPPLNLPPIVDIAMGNFHVIALDRAGKVYTWGNARESGADWGQTSFPEDLPPIKAIAADGYKTMLLTEDGRVLSFGDTNGGGQEYVPDMPRIVAIACSAYTSLAIDKDGYIHAWGLDFPSPQKFGPNITGMSTVNYDFVSLGADGRILEHRDASIYSDMGELSYRPFPNLSNITKISGSSQNYAAIDNNGNVVVWGYYMSDPDPVVNPPDDMPPIKDIAFTVDSAVALGVDGKLYEWGPFRKGPHASNIANPAPSSVIPAEKTDEFSGHLEDKVIPSEERKNSILPLYLPGLVLVVCAISFVIYRIARVGGNNRAKDADTAARITGNHELDKILGDIAEHISNLRRLDEAVEGKLDEPVRDILKTTEQIVEQVQKNPAVAGEMYQFLNYTLPTTINLLQNYYEFSQQPFQGRNIVASMEKIEGMMDTIVDAFHRQLDALFRDKALGINMEIEVMKNMLSKAGDITDIICGNDNK